MLLVKSSKMDDIYSKIYDFCKSRNVGSCFKNDPVELTPRVSFLIDLLDELKIEYEIDRFPISGTTGYNIILAGSSDKMVVAHHDIVNPKIDNANDNSCSVINAIALKVLAPHIHVVLLDGEEVGGLGSQRAADLINEGKFGKIAWVLNLELSGKGGDFFFIGDYPGKLSDSILEKFDCPVVSTPFNDAVIFRRNGIDSVVINPLPPLTEGKTSRVKYKDKYLDFDMLYNCHSSRDTLDTIDPVDMQRFVEEVLLKIVE
jgi:hypothetical protein